MSFRSALLAADKAFRSMSPEEWYSFCKTELFPDITPDQAEQIYPLFLKATDPALCTGDRSRYMQEYCSLIKPLRKR